LPRRLSLGVVAFGACVTFVRPASALGPVGVEIGALVGGASNPSYPPPILGLGLGGRAGVSLGGVYLGAAITEYLGGSATLPNGFADSTHTLLVGAQGGLTMRFGPLKLRPLLELGVADLSEAGQSNATFYAQAGAAFLFFVGPLFFGADLAGLVVPSYTRPCPSCRTLLSNAEVAFIGRGELGVAF